MRTTLRWDLNPVPTLYCNIESIPKSLLPSQTTGRVAPKDRSTLEVEHSKFCNIDRISNFEDLNESFCPPCYQLKKDENEAIFYKIQPHSVLSIHNHLKQLLFIKYCMLSSFQLLLLFLYQNAFVKEATVV